MKPLEDLEGDFIISPLDGKLYLEAQISQEGASLGAGNWTGAHSQQWRVSKTNSGAYALQNKQNGGYIGRATPNDSSEESAVQLLYAEDPSSAWYIRPAPGTENGYLICADPRIKECLICKSDELVVSELKSTQANPIWILNSTNADASTPNLPTNEGLSMDGKMGLVGSFAGAAVGVALAIGADKAFNGGNFRAKTASWLKTRWNSITWNPQKWQMFNR